MKKLLNNVALTLCSFGPIFISFLRYASVMNDIFGINETLPLLPLPKPYSKFILHNHLF